MFYRKILISIYLFISKIYVFLFGRKKMQFINDIFFSLSLDAKGFKHYGHLYNSGEKNFIKLIKDELSLSLDIGANVGEYTKLLLSKTNSDVVSFEPLKGAFKKLEKIKSQFNSRLEIHNIALGSENTSKNLFYEHEESEKASLISNLEKLSIIKNKNKNKMKVEVKKLDNFKNYFTKKKIDFIKIDSEGFEFEILKGAKDILDIHKPKFIQIEFGWHHLIKNETLYRLSELIYFSDVFRVLPYGNKLLHVDPSRPENNIYHLSNYIFIRKDISTKYK